MKFEPNLGLRKPDGNDYVLISDANTNMDIIGDTIGNLAQLETTAKHSLVAAINESRRASTARSPYINPDTGTWFEFDVTIADFVDTGVQAQGDAAGFGAPTATTETIAPGELANVSVVASGADTAKVFAFTFKIPQGAKGDAALPIELQVSNNSIQWRVQGDATWIDIVSLTDLMGADGREIELRNTDTHIQWRYVGDVTWINLVSLQDIVGPQGKPGREVELHKSATHIQWRYAGELTWHDLVSLADITGAQGIAGREVKIRSTTTHIQWQYDGDANWIDIVAVSDLIGAQGEPGREVVFQKSDTHIQWRYVGDTEWTNLVPLDAITGPTGRGLVIIDFFPTFANLIASVPSPSEGDAYGVGAFLPFDIYVYGRNSGWVNNGPIQGPAGTNGREIVIRTTTTHIQWQYAGEVAWTNIIALSEITGDDGVSGREVELFKSATHIQWRYVGETVWNNLVSLADITGPAGTPADPAITDQLRVDVDANATAISNLQSEATAKWILLNTVDTRSRASANDIVALQTDVSAISGRAETAIADASEAKTTANTAITNAGTAKTAADNAQTTANDANSNANGRVSKSGDTMTGKLNLPASTANLVPLNIPVGVAPNAPVAGDVWFDTNLHYHRDGAAHMIRDSVNTSLMSQADAEAGVSTETKVISAQRLRQGADAAITNKFKIQATNDWTTATLPNGAWGGVY